MTLWDGLTSVHSTGQAQRIIVLGATNRMNDIDDAILRRMPKKFPVSLPGTTQRRSLLRLILRDTKLDPVLFNLDYMANITAGMSGSDMKEACRDAAMAPLREYLRQNRGNSDAIRATDPSQLRGVRNSDFFASLGGGDQASTTGIAPIISMEFARSPVNFIRVRNGHVSEESSIALDASKDGGTFVPSP
jgi:SpoVK/Ycf46/Vps4 family AAA+-type ATPase